MKKAFFGTVLCVLFNNTWTMSYARRIAGVSDEEVAASVERQKKLSPEEQKHLDTMLCHNLRLYGRRTTYFNGTDEDYERPTFNRVRALLLAGANPNTFDRDDPTVLTLAVKLNFYKIAALLLAYGADPNLENPKGLYWVLPIPNVRDLDMLQLLVRAGADINKTSKKVDSIPALAVLCGSLGYRELADVIWPLSHGADPNIGCNAPWGYPIYATIHKRNLEGTIALLQYKIRLDIPGQYSNNLFDYVQQICSCDKGEQPALAIYELLKAISEHKLDPHHVYKMSEYEAMGISPESAALIQKGMQEVNEAFVQCALDDFKFEHPGQNITEFLLNRELSPAGRARR